MPVANPVCFSVSANALKPVVRTITVLYAKTPTPPTQGQLWPRGTK